MLLSAPGPTRWTDTLLQIRAEWPLRVQEICLVWRGQPEPLDVLICPFGFCRTVKCLGKYTVKPQDGNIRHRENSGHRATSLEFFWAEPNKSQTSVASLFMYMALQLSFQLPEISEIASLVTKQCCYQQEAYEPNLNPARIFRIFVLHCAGCWPHLTILRTFFLACFSVLYIIISELGFHFSACFPNHYCVHLPSLMCSVFQVAIHSVLEKLFRSIWSLPNSRAPFAIKYFFDFLDAQAENKKITDPDVVHIWKTNRWEQAVGDCCF